MGLSITLFVGSERISFVTNEIKEKIVMNWSNYPKCLGCPNRYQCNEAGECLDVRRNRVDAENRAAVKDALATYDAQRAVVLAARALDPKYEAKIDKPALCWHTFSPFGICTKAGCGYWKKPV